MKKYAPLLFLLLSVVAISCGDDIPDSPGGGDGGSGTKNNSNCNAGIISEQKEIAVSESDDMEMQQVADRMEMPRLQGGSSNLFVVHTLTDGKVNYAMEYDCNKKASRWTAFRWDKTMNSHNGSWNRYAWKNGETFNGYGGNADPFQPDMLIPEAYRTTLADHTRNGHDRGHMLGSADRLNSKEANGQTFYLSNMHPQLNGFNADGIWYALEERLRKMYDIDSFRDTLYVVKGGTIAEGQYTMVKGGGNPLVCPKYFFMALLCKNSQKSQGGYKAIAFWMEHKENSDVNFADYVISIDQLEQKTGIDFFCNLPDDIEAAVEKNVVPATWGIK